MTKLQVFSALLAALTAFVTDLHSYALARKDAIANGKEPAPYDWLLAITRTALAGLGGFGMSSIPGAGE